MDDANKLQELAAAERHVALCEKNVANQRAVIAELERDGHDTTGAHEVLRGPRRDAAPICQGPRSGTERTRSCPRSGSQHPVDGRPADLECLGDVAGPHALSLQFADPRSFY